MGPKYSLNKKPVALSCRWWRFSQPGSPVLILYGTSSNHHRGWRGGVLSPAVVSYVDIISPPLHVINWFRCLKAKCLHLVALPILSTCYIADLGSLHHYTMLSSFGDVVRQPTYSAWSSISNTCKSIFMATLLLATWYMLWRLWRFTIRPHLRPDEPKELPYWIPCECSHREYLMNILNPYSSR